MVVEIPVLVQALLTAVQTATVSCLRVVSVMKAVSRQMTVVQTFLQFVPPVS